MENSGRKRDDKYVSLRRVTAVLVLFLLGFCASTLAQEVEVIKVGRFWTEQTDDGALGPVSFSSGWWPADFDVTANETHIGSSISGISYLLTTNWETPDGENYDKVVCGLQSPFNSAGTIIDPQKSYMRYHYQGNKVNDEEYMPDQIGELAPDQMVGSCDQVVTVTNEFAIGVQVKRRVYAWSQQNHDDYVINDLLYENVSGKTLTDFFVSVAMGPADFEQAWGQLPSPGDQGSDFRWAHYYGAAPGDSQRVFYTYHADDPQVVGDNMGNPAFDQQGRLIKHHAYFMGFLHVSDPFTGEENGPTDVDNPVQPKVTFRAYAPKIGIPEPRSRYGVSINNAGWYDAVSGGAATPADTDAPAGTWHQLGLDEMGLADFTGGGVQGLGYSGTARNEFASVGPFDFQAGEKIHIILVAGTAGLSNKMATEVGKKMVEGTLSEPPNLPDPNTGYFPPNFVFPEGATEQHKMKDRWLSTVIDSVHKVMYNAQWNFEHNWNVPDVPPPPVMSVKGFPDNATITWSDPEAEADSRFAGYRIMRRKSRMDTAFAEVIKTFGPEIKEEGDEHQYEDTEVQFGASYTYFVQAAWEVDENDTDALPSIRGEKVWSARPLVPPLQSIEPPRGGTESLTDIQIAPNPYNINDPVVIAQGWTDFRGIVFFNLPAYCEIDIYTEGGDHVQKIIHDSPVKAGSLHWDMITESDQVIASGVYIATFTDKNGDVAFRKFAVVR